MKKIGADTDKSCEAHLQESSAKRQATDFKISRDRNPKTRSVKGGGNAGGGIAALAMALHSGHRNMLQNAAQLCVVALKLVQHTLAFSSADSNKKNPPTCVPPALKPGRAPN